jgi:outer membrane translocation and assembly module TamA
VGPVLDLTRTLRGLGPSNSHFLSLETELGVKTHYFEFYRNSPRSGFRSLLNLRFNSADAFSDASAQRLQLISEALWNLGEKDPPLVVLGLRGGVFTTLTPERLNEGATSLPPTYRHYLGGSADLRGFGLDELPDAEGSFSAAFADFEARLGGVLPLGIQPFGFLDVGLTGREPVRWALPLYWNPGFGLRWESPIGVFRTTLAHGYVTGQPESPRSHWQFFFSFGEEF